MCKKARYSVKLLIIVVFWIADSAFLSKEQADWVRTWIYQLVVNPSPPDIRCPHSLSWWPCLHRTITHIAINKLFTSSNVSTWVLLSLFQVQGSSCHVWDFLLNYVIKHQDFFCYKSMLNTSIQCSLQLVRVNCCS